MLAITFALGTWQVHRLHWKRSLIAEIERGEQGGPTPLTGAAKPFQRVVVSGRFQPNTARYGVELRTMAGRGVVLGSQVLNAFVSDAGLTVIVDRGWAPADDDSAPPTGNSRFEGYVRPSERLVLFGVRDDPVARRFYTLNSVAIGRALGTNDAEPYIVVALGPHGAPPIPASTFPRPPNDHLSYAVTWFSLSAALAVVFGLYAFRAVHKRPSVG